MIALDRARRTLVLAVRGTASLSDAITDIALVPVDASRCVPDDVRATLDGPALAHSGILQAAEAILTHVDTLGLLDALLDGCHTRLCQHAASLDEAASAELAAQASGPLARVASARVSDPTALEAAAKAALPDTKGWRLVVTGHSLGAGTAALLALMLKPRVPGVRCWAFSPPGCTVSSALLAYTRSFIVSVAAGKDVVPRASAAALNRLVDEMIVSLGRCRHPKLKVLLGGWWRRKARPPPSALFHAYEDIPDEPREFIRKYFLLEDIKDRGIIPMFPPDKIVFLRPLKSRKATAARDAFTVKSWDAVWATAEELAAEGIIVGRSMVEHHLVEGTVLEAVAHSIIWHPDNPASPQERQAQRALARRLKKVADLVVETRPEDDKFISMEAGTRI